MNGPNAWASPAEDHCRAQALVANYRDIFDRVPDGVWAAPGRVNLIGEHTDYNDGYVLPFALPHATFVAAGHGRANTLRVHSLNSAESVEIALDSLVPSSVTGWAAYAAGMFWALEQAGYQVGGTDIVLETDVPQGAGLSSSAALECAVGLALTDLHEHAIPPLKLAEIAQRAENNFVGMPCGLMDQMVAMLGRDGHFVQFDNRSREALRIPFNTTGAEILIIDSNAPHRLVDGEYAVRRRQCESAASQLGLTSLRELNDEAAGPLQDALEMLDDEVQRRRVRHVVTENQRVLDTVAALAGGDLVAAGQLMTASHISLRDDYEVSVPEVDLAQQTLVDSNAYGARITGGGFGGCVVALVRSEDTEELTAHVRATYARAGYSEPDAFVAVPAQGARRVR